MKTFFYVLLLGITITACTPDEEQPNFELLTASEWQLQSATKNMVSVLSDCRLNDAVTFNPNGDLDYITNDENCGDVEITGRNWTFQDNGAIVRVKYRARGEDIPNSVIFEYWRIVELTVDRLVIEDDTAEENDLIPEIRVYVH